MGWTKWVLVAVAAFVMVGCGDDGGDDGTVDSGTRCTSASDCDDGLFCNGEEACEMSACVVGEAPCAAGSCDEDEDTCTSDCADADGDGQTDAACGGDDCDDSDANRFVGNPEICDPDDHDEDCDATTFGFRDQDMDGASDAACCNGDNCGTDCDDMRATVGASPLETCDGLDNDCDSMVDEGVLITFYPDADLDGYGDPDGTVMMACMPPVGFVSTATDCDDTNDEIHPGAYDTCEPEDIDQDCDGTPDNPATGCTCDDGTHDCPEQRGACAGSTFVCSSGMPGMCSYTPQAESCDGLDNDCNGMVDDALPTVTYYRDADADGFGDAATTQEACEDPGAGWVTNGNDCDDTDSDAFPGQTEFFDTPANGGGFDYDCSLGTVEMEYPLSRCGCRDMTCGAARMGYFGDSSLQCGEEATLGSACTGGCFTCEPLGTRVRVACH